MSRRRCMGETPKGFIMPKNNVREPRLSASAVISRKKGGCDEILLGHRVSEMPSFPDFWAFPGGGISKVDIKFSIDNSNFLAQMEEDRVASICLLREIAEEVGFTPDKLGNMISLDSEIRSNVYEDKHNWSESIRKREIIISKFDAKVITERVTPPFAPIRFKNKFFHVRLGDDLIEPTFPPGISEFDEFRWWEPNELLNSWKNNEVRLPPPIVTLIRDLVFEIEKSGNLADACEELSRKRPSGYHRIEFAPYIECMPIRTETLPPATHTNCYIIGEVGGERVIVDPASKCEESIISLASKIKEVQLSGSKIVGTIFTHRHPDHIGDLNKISKIYDAPIWATSETHEQIPDVKERIILREGSEFVLNGPSGQTSWQIIETFGHCPGHICIIGESGIISGDNCVGVGSILVPSGEGHMGKYIQGLKRLKGFNPKMLFPGHGPLIANPEKLLNKYILHRENRHEGVFRAIKDGFNTLREITKFVYMDDIGINYALAEDQVLAHVKQLIKENKIIQKDRHYYSY